MEILASSPKEGIQCTHFSYVPDIIGSHFALVVALGPYRGLLKQATRNSFQLSKQLLVKLTYLLLDEEGIVNINLVKMNQQNFQRSAEMHTEPLTRISAFLLILRLEWALIIRLRVERGYGFLIAIAVPDSPSGNLLNIDDRHLNIAD